MKNSIDFNTLTPWKEKLTVKLVRCETKLGDSERWEPENLWTEDPEEKRREEVRSKGEGVVVFHAYDKKSRHSKEQDNFMDLTISTIWTGVSGLSGIHHTFH